MSDIKDSEKLFRLLLKSCRLHQCRKYICNYTDSLPIVESPFKLTMVKEIGSKQAEQLKRLRIDTVEDLAKASAKSLSAKTEDITKSSSQMDTRSG